MLHRLSSSILHPALNPSQPILPLVLSHIWHLPTNPIPLNPRLSRTTIPDACKFHACPSPSESGEADARRCARSWRGLPGRPAVGRARVGRPGGFLRPPTPPPFVSAGRLGESLCARRGDRAGVAVGVEAPMLVMGEDGEVLDSVSDGRRAEGRSLRRAAPCAVGRPGRPGPRCGPALAAGASTRAGPGRGAAAWRPVRGSARRGLPRTIAAGRRAAGALSRRKRIRDWV